LISSISKRISPDSRRLYSAVPASTQAGMRVPSASRRTRKSGVLFFAAVLFAAVLGVAALCVAALGIATIRMLVRIAPEAFQVIELAGGRQHDVYDHIAQVDQDPFGVLLAFHAHWRVAVGFGLFSDVVRERFDMA